MDLKLDRKYKVESTYSKFFGCVNCKVLAALLGISSPLDAFERRAPESGVGRVHPANGVEVPVEDAEAALPPLGPEVGDERPPVSLGAVDLGRAQPLSAVAPSLIHEEHVHHVVHTNIQCC